MRFLASAAHRFLKADCSSSWSADNRTPASSPSIRRPAKPSGKAAANPLGGRPKKGWPEQTARPLEFRRETSQLFYTLCNEHSREAANTLLDTTRLDFPRPQNGRGEFLLLVLLASQRIGQRNASRRRGRHDFHFRRVLQNWIGTAACESRRQKHQRSLARDINGASLDNADLPRSGYLYACQRSQRTGCADALRRDSKPAN